MMASGGIVGPSFAIHELREQMRLENDEFTRKLQDLRYWKVKSVTVRGDLIVVSLNKPLFESMAMESTHVVPGPGWLDRWRGDKIEFKALREMDKWIDICNERNAEIKRAAAVNEELKDRLEWRTRK